MVTKYLAFNGKVSIIYADTTDLIEYVKKIQKLTYTTTNIMAKFYTASSILAFSDIKEETDELIVQIDGEKTGLLYSIVRLQNNNAITKGFIENSQIESNEDISNLIGKSGSIAIVKNNKYSKLGYKGITPLISGNIIDDFESYFSNSTQKPAFMDIKIADEKVVGYLITFMPDITDKEIAMISENISKTNFEELITSNANNDEIIRNLIGDKNIEKIQDNIDIKFVCDCSKEKYREMFYSLKKSDLQDLINQDDVINVVCDYCKKSYDFSREELEEILKKL